MALIELLQDYMVIETCALINSYSYYSFCISYAATKYGRGVYFAVNAKYSADDLYSKPDANGNKYMFVACVLTGKYTKGEEDLKTPPPIDPQNPLKLYDSVVNNLSSPAMFVVFYDAQCYPEYLITFK